MVVRRTIRYAVHDYVGVWRNSSFSRDGIEGEPTKISKQREQVLFCAFGIMDYGYSRDITVKMVERISREEVSSILIQNTPLNMLAQDWESRSYHREGHIPPRES